MEERSGSAASLLSDDSFARLSPSREGGRGYTRGYTGAASSYYGAATSASSPLRYTQSTMLSSVSPSHSVPSSRSPQRLQQLVTSQQKRINSLEQENKELEKQLEESVQLNEQMGEQIQKQYSTRDTLNSKLKKSEEENKRLQHELDRLKQNYELEQEAAEKRKATLEEDYKYKLDRAREEQETLRKELNDNKTELEKSQEELHTLKGQYSALQTQYGDTASKAQQAEEALNRIHKEKEELDTRLKQTRTELEERSRLLQEQRDQYNDEKSSWESSMKSLQENKEETESKVEELRRDLKEKNERLQHLQKTEETYGNEANTLNQQVQTLNAEISAYQEELSKARSKNSTLETDLNYWKKSSTNLENELKQLRERMLQYQDAHKELEVVKGENEDLREQCSTLALAREQHERRESWFFREHDRLNMQLEDVRASLVNKSKDISGAIQRFGFPGDSDTRHYVGQALLRLLYSFRAGFHAHLASCEVTCRSQQSRNYYRDTVNSGTFSKAYGERLTLESLADSPSFKEKQNKESGRPQSTETIDGILIECHQRLAVLCRRMSRASCLVSVKNVERGGSDGQSSIPLSLFSFIDSATTEAHQLAMSTLQWAYSTNSLPADETWLSEYTLAHVTQASTKFAEECAGEVGRFCRVAANMNVSNATNFEDFCKAVAKLRSCGVNREFLFNCLNDFPCTGDMDSRKLLESSNVLRQRARIEMINIFCNSTDSLEQQMKQRLNKNYWVDFAREDLQNLRQILLNNASAENKSDSSSQSNEEFLAATIDMFGMNIENGKFPKDGNQIPPKAMQQLWYKPVLGVLTHISEDWVGNSSGNYRSLGQSFDVEECLTFCDFLEQELRAENSPHDVSKKGESERLSIALQHSILEYCRCLLSLVSSMGCISIPYNIWISRCLHNLMCSFSETDRLRHTSVLRDNDQFSARLGSTVKANGITSHSLARLVQHAPEELHSILSILREQKQLVEEKQDVLAAVGVDVNVDATMSADLQRMKDSEQSLVGWLSFPRSAIIADPPSSFSKLVQVSVSVDRFAFEERVKCKNEQYVPLPQPGHSRISSLQEVTSSEARNQLHALFGNGIHHSADPEQDVATKINVASLTTLLCLHLLLGASVEESILAAHPKTPSRHKSSHTKDTVAPVKRLEEIAKMKLWNCFEDFLSIMNRCNSGMSHLCSHSLQRGVIESGCFSRLQTFSKTPRKAASLKDMLLPTTSFTLRALYLLTTSVYSHRDVEIFHVLSRLRLSNRTQRTSARPEIKEKTSYRAATSTGAATDLMMELEDALELSSIPEYPDDDTDDSPVFELSPETVRTPFQELKTPDTKTQRTPYNSPDMPLSGSFSITPLADRVLQTLNEPTSRPYESPSRHYESSSHQYESPSRQVESPYHFGTGRLRSSAEASPSRSTTSNDNHHLNASLSESQVEQLNQRAFQSPNSEVRKVLSKLQEVRSNFKSMLHQLDNNVSSSSNIRRGNLDVVRSSVETATKKLETAEQAKRTYEQAEYPKSINAAGSFIVSVYGAEAAVSALQRVLNSLYRER
eukprot:gb/GECG01000998.1/.p1 GENE.gb/GECG01000998.1/~~gb/GECG01000998.1/.p1  ORF type:complete len:1542 (+),score=262.96 gb/GECG01000998.1/:1-4626(+)